jgi:hypothetical protein
MMRASGAALVLALAAAAAGCAEPVIEMRLELPPSDKADRFNVSCVGAVQVIVRGNDRGLPFMGPNDPGSSADDRGSCITVQNPASWAALRSSIAGKFRFDLPESGLAGVEIRGATGTCKEEGATGDTIFYGSAEYDGGTIEIPMTPNLSCSAARTEVVRPVDLLALTRNGTCLPVVNEVLGGVDSATIHGALFGTLLDFNSDFAGTVDGVSSLRLYVTSDEASCVALAYGDNLYRTTASCVRRGTGVCSSAGQIELPIINGNFAVQSADDALIEKYGGWVIGAVWGTDANGAKIKLTGAKVTPLDATKAKVVYADLPAGAAKLTSLPAATATNASGLFIAYVGEPVDFVISATGYKDETVRMASPDEPSTALVMMTKR